MSAKNEKAAPGKVGRLEAQLKRARKALREERDMTKLYSDMWADARREYDAYKQGVRDSRGADE